AIVRDVRGEPTGILQDAAMDLVNRVTPALPDQELEQALERAMQHAVERGVTQVHDMGGFEDGRVISIYRRARASDKLRLRIYSFLPLSAWEQVAEYQKKHGSGDDWLPWGATKGYVDGSLGSTTAWFHKPYNDAPDTAGLTVVDPERLRAQMVGANQA